MKVTIKNSASASLQFLLAPIAKDKNFNKTLSAIASKTATPLDLLKQDFAGNAKETHTLYYIENGKSRRLTLLGLGEKPKFADILSTFRSFTFSKKAQLPTKIGITFDYKNAPENMDACLEAAINGIIAGRYDIGRFKTEEKKEKNFLNGKAAVEVIVEKSAADLAKKAVEKGQQIAETQLQIFDLVNAPSNKKVPQVLADWAVKSGKENGFKVKVLDKKAIEKLGLHGLLAVNRGSEFPPTFIIMEHKPKGVKNPKKVGLVGKGVTFDTGGLSIKPSQNMHYMKSDMGGAAAVMGTMEVAAKMNLPVHLFGIVPATDNSVDALSIKPSDVIGSYSGKTIEIIDTDAEGRLILADGLAYMEKHFSPEIMIDLATLTGSAIRALGTVAGALFSNNDDLADALYDCGQTTGERVWRLPIWEDYAAQMKSDVADIKNFSGRPTAGAITAAKFLEFFINKHPKWAHLDIAGMAVADSEYASQKSATGFGIRLLIEFLRRV